jgi:ribonuclease P protein component
LLYIKKNDQNKNRFGVVVSKKTGNAVCRVRLKRLFREIFRNEEEKFITSYDYIFIAKRTAGEKFKELKIQELKKDVLRIFKKAGLLK